jgi:hypothetical protein
MYVPRNTSAPSHTPSLHGFSYGTSRQVDVQVANFGRELGGELDVLPGHRLDWLDITDPHVIRVSGSARHPVVRADRR